MIPHSRIKTVHELRIYLQQAKLSQDSIWNSGKQLNSYLQPGHEQHIKKHNIVHYTLPVTASKEQLFTLCHGSCFQLGCHAYTDPLQINAKLAYT